MVDWLGLVLVIGLIGSGVLLVQSMERGRSILEVRFLALLSLLFMVGFLVWALWRW